MSQVLQVQKLVLAAGSPLQIAAAVMKTAPIKDFHKRLNTSRITIILKVNTASQMGPPIRLITTTITLRVLPSGSPLSR